MSNAWNICGREHYIWLFLYFIPASVLAADTRYFEPLPDPFFRGLLVLIIILSVFKFVCTLYHFQDGQEKNLKEGRNGNRPFKSDDFEWQYRDDVLSEYTQLLEEFRYRDGWLIRSLYFSGATFAILAGIIVTVQIEGGFRNVIPSIGAIGTVIGFTFAIVSSSFYQSRSQIENQLNDIENSFSGKFSVYRITQIECRDEFSKFSVGRVIKTFHVTMTFLWLGIYLWTTGTY